MASRRGNVEFELSSGPPGATLSKSGEFVWNVPSDWKDDVVNVILTVRNSDGQSLYDSFRITAR